MKAKTVRRKGSPHRAIVLVDDLLEKAIARLPFLWKSEYISQYLPILNNGMLMSHFYSGSSCKRPDDYPFKVNFGYFS